MKRFYIFLLLIFCIALLAQPQSMGDFKVQFTYHAPNADQVYLSGGFNRWNPTDTPMEKDDSGNWIIILEFEPGMHQYKFVVDGVEWVQDPENPATTDDNYGGLNSVFVLDENSQVQLESKPQGPVNPEDEYPDGPKVYLAMVWHQHQPLYADPSLDYLRGPWVRLHATKDYYDMAAMLTDYPDIHVTINLTSVLLQQLQDYYVARLGEVVQGDKVDEENFFKHYANRTDPWIDLLLKDTDKFNANDDYLLTQGAWNAYGISEVMLERFPEYKAIKDKGSDLSVDEKLQLKCWFAIAWFDPDFLEGPVELVTGQTVDLSDLVEKKGERWYQINPFNENDANRLVAESYKVMAAVVPAHKQLITEARGEIITTPYYHPILPLIYNSDIAKICQPGDPMPTKYSYPEDAHAQVVKGKYYFNSLFNAGLVGMWPGEGSVSEQVIPVFADAGIRWILTADAVLSKSTPKNQPLWQPYRVDPDKTTSTQDTSKALAVFFRDTELSDRIGFKYQTLDPEEAAEDFVQKVLSYSSNGKDRLINVILDGENAWEWYRTNPDGKQFLNALYRKLSKLYKLGRITTVTPSEYIVGNSERGIPVHPIMDMPELEPLWPGSWINANYDTWIGEKEENIAWNLLGQVRKDLESWDIAKPDYSQGLPEDNKLLAKYNTWEAIYAAEGSDWFWWFGQDQGAPGGDLPFDEAFRTHLTNVYRYAKMAGIEIEVPEFDPIVQGNSSGGGAMARGSGEKVDVLFTVDASEQRVKDAIYIVGEAPELGGWTPNQVRMYDDGTHGDIEADDEIWSIEFPFNEGTYLEYKYTNSGNEGSWIPGEEFPVENRAVSVEGENGKMIIKDIFGQK